MAFRSRTGIVPSSAKTSSSNSGAVGFAELGNTLTVFLDVTAVSGTSPTLDVKVEWSHDGTTFFAADTADTFTQVTAAKSVCKQFAVKAPFYRLVWTTGGTTPSFTFAAHEYVTS